MKNEKTELTRLYHELLEKKKVFEQEFRSKHVQPYICVICKNSHQLNVIDPLWPDQLPPVLEQQQGPWNNGTVVKASFGYGSTLDTESYFFGICDTCMTELVESKLARPWKDFKLVTSKEQIDNK